MKTTIQDVAKRAGVSTGTVSNALTGKRPVADATRKKIMAAMDALGYQPNLLARGLVNQRSHVLSIVITELKDLGYYGYSSALTGIQRKANELGYSLMLHFAEESTEDEVFTTLAQIQSRRSDGIIWAIHEIGDNRDWIHQLDADQYPPICFLNMQPSPTLNVVTVDNEAGAYMAVSHLIQQGGEKIGIITGPLDWWESQARVAGWKKALKQAGLQYDSTLVVEGNWLAESGEKGMENLLNQKPDIDGVFACNDSMALGAIHTITQRGLSIPDDLLLVGYDNTPESASYWPSLTTVHQRLQESGQIAVTELHHIIENDTAAKYQPQQHILQPELVIRDSSISRKIQD